MGKYAIILIALVHACCFSAESAPPRALHAEAEKILTERRPAAWKRYQFPKNSALFLPKVKDRVEVDGAEWAMPIFVPLVKHRVDGDGLGKADGRSTPLIRWAIPADQAKVYVPFAASIALVDAYAGGKFLLRDFEEMPTEERRRIVQELTGITDWDFFAEKISYYITYRKTSVAGANGQNIPAGQVVVLMWLKKNVILLDLSVKGDADSDVTFVAAWHLGVQWLETVMLRNAARQ